MRAIPFRNDVFISSLNNLKTMPQLQLNEIISKSAEKYVQIFSSEKIHTIHIYQ